MTDKQTTTTFGLLELLSAANYYSDHKVTFTNPKLTNKVTWIMRLPVMVGWWWWWVACLIIVSLQVLPFEILTINVEY